jgi:electron transport complex protein RnfB
MLKEMLLASGVMGGLGIIFAAGLAWAAGKFSVDSDPKVELLSSLLPGANCGSCGCSGCSGYAEALVAGTVSVDACNVCDAEAKQEICSILGVEASELGKRQVAKVRCRGDYSLARWVARYEGAQDCRAASMVGSSPKGCREGCLGLGTCTTVCTFGAITLGEDHLPVVDEEKCTGCGACAAACPRHVIAIMDYDAPLVVRCNSHGRGRPVRENCQVGCLGCRACVKACEQDAITMVYNLAVVDLTKCIGCGACAEKCPSGCIEMSQIGEKKKILTA